MRLIEYRERRTPRKAGAGQGGKGGVLSLESFQRRKRLSRSLRVWDGGGSSKLGGRWEASPWSAVCKLCDLRPGTGALSLHCPEQSRVCCSWLCTCVEVEGGQGHENTAED